MTSNRFIKIFEANFDTLWAKYLATSDVEHRGEKGSLREAFVREIIETLIPSHFGLGSGVVTDYQGKESSQADIILYDKRLPPPLFQREGRGIYPMDSVVRVLEVKSVLDSDALTQARAAAWKLHPDNPDGLKLARSGKLLNGRANYPLFGIFAYGSKLADLSSAIAKQGDLKFQPPMAILDRGVCFAKSSGLVTIGKNSELTRLFFSTYLHHIEEEAISRGNFGLLEWLGTNFSPERID